MRARAGEVAAASAPAFDGAGSRTPICTRSVSRYRRRSLRCSTCDEAGRLSSASIAAAGPIGRRHDLDVADHVLAAAQRSHRHRPGDAAAPRRRIEHRSRRRRRRVRAECAGSRARSAGSAAATAASTVASRPGSARSLLCRRRRRSGRRPRSTPRRAWMTRELLDGDRARFEQPAQVGRKIGDRRLDQHPAAGFVHLPQPLEDFGIDVRRAAFSNSGPRSASDSIRCARTRSSARAHSAASVGIAAHRRQRRELFERLVERGRRGIGPLAFQGAGFGRRLLRARLSFRSADWRRASRRCRP